MRRLSLTIAAFASILSVPALLCIGIQSLVSGSIQTGLLLIFVGIPVALAHAVVYDYVGEKIDAAGKDIESTSSPVDFHSPTKGTPWERDPGHTRE